MHKGINQQTRGEIAQLRKKEKEKKEISIRGKIFAEPAQPNQKLRFSMLFHMSGCRHNTFVSVEIRDQRDVKLDGRARGVKSIEAKAVPNLELSGTCVVGKIGDR